MPETHNENLPLKENGIAGEETMETAIVKPRKKWTKYQKLHLALTLLLLAVCIALAVMYVLKLGFTKTSTSSKSARSVCETPECVEIAAQVLTYADHSINPCVNFYDYACAGWKKRRYIPDSKATWDTFSDLMDANDKLMKKTLGSGKPEKDSPAEVQLYKLYSSCLDTSAIDKLGYAPLKALIAKMGSWSATDPKWNESTWNMTQALVNIHSTFAPIVYMETGAPLFDIRIVVDIKNSSNPIVKVSPIKF